MTQHILALETSGSWCGVALWRATGDQGSAVVREHPGTKEHSERLLPMVDEVLAEAGIARSAIDAIAFGQGPGGFTGLRVACGVAQGLGFALDRPLAPIPSHAALAWEGGAKPGQVILAAMDARMEEVYAAAYRQDAETVVCLDGPVLLAAGDLLRWARAHAWYGDDIVHAGEAWQAYATVLGGGAVHVTAERPTARAVGALGAQALANGAVVSPELAAPLYVRDKVAFTTAERALGAGGNPRASQAPVFSSEGSA